MTDNMNIWNQVCVTNKDTTKPIEGKGFAGTSINPTSIYEKLTGLFGPCGMGWGYTVMDEYYREGHTDGENTTVLHVCKVGLWYETEWEIIFNQDQAQATKKKVKSTPIEAFGQTYFTRHTRSGWTTDEEAPKKSMTDAITKAASMLGVSADIYAGKWDGDKYGNKDKTTPTKSIKSTTGTACPECGQTDSVIASKFSSGGYVCFLKKKGCGAKFDGSEPPKPAPNKKSEDQDDIPMGGVPGYEYPKDGKVEYISEGQRKLLFVKSKDAGWTDVELKEYLDGSYGIQSTKEIPVGQFNEILKYVN